jgi:hypothetical protein
MSLQINRMFQIEEINHLVIPRLSHPKVRIEYGDVKGYDGMVVPTKRPEHVVLCMESSRMHFFLHDYERVRVCLWDKGVTYDEKKEIVLNMMQWLQEFEYSFDHLLLDHEDGCIFTEVSNELASP